MRLQHRLTLSLSLLAAVALVGCGKKPIDPEKRTRAQVEQDAEQDKSSARLKLKSRVQAEPKSGEARYALGAFLLAEGDAAAAVIELERALEFKHPESLVMPKLAEALLQSGQNQRLADNYSDTKLAEAPATARLLATVAQAWVQLGDAKRAGDLVTRALAAEPTSGPALVMKARLAGIANDIPAALATLDKLLAVQPGNDEAWSLKGDFLLRTPDGTAAAMDAFGKALQARPDQVYAHSALLALQLSQGKLDAAKKQFDALSKVAPKSMTTALYESHIAYATGDYARARELHQMLLRAMPENLNVLLAAGETELALGGVVQAETLFAKASTLAPRNTVARRLLGQAQLRLGQAPKALLTLAPLVDDADASAEVLALAAQARQLNGETKAADALYARIAKQKPTDPRLRTIVANARFGKDPDAAVFTELAAIAKADTGTSADMVMINAQLARGQLDAALASADALLVKRPKEASGHHIQGQILIQKNDAAGARKRFEKALTVDTTYFPSVSALAALDIKEGKADAARQRLETLVKAQPKNARAMLALAEVMTRQARPRAEVLKQIEAAIKAAPLDVDARVALITYQFNGGNTDAALTAATAATVAMPENLELLELLGRGQLRAGQSSQAIATYGKMISKFPKSPRGHVGLADVHLAGKQLDQARKSINQALELVPNLPEAQAQLVVVAVRSGQPAQALEIARKMQSQRSADAAGFLIEGEIEMGRNNLDAAASALRKAVGLASPGAAPVKLHHVLARAGKTADANAFAASWTTSHPQDSNFLFYLGDAAQQAGKLDLADGHYQKVLAIQPSHALALNNLAMLHLQQKKPDALDLATRAAQGAPDDPAVLDTLAQALASTDKLSQAIETQKRAVALAPVEGNLRLSLAKLHLQAGEKALAKAELEKLNKLGSQFAQHDQVTGLLTTLGSSLPGR